MPWSNGEDRSEQRQDSGLIGIGTLIKLAVPALIGACAWLGAKVIDHGEKLSAVDAKFQFIVDALHRIEDKQNSLHVR